MYLTVYRTIIYNSILGDNIKKTSTLYYMMARKETAIRRNRDKLPEPAIQVRGKCTAEIGEMFKWWYGAYGWTTAEMDFGKFFQMAKRYQKSGEHHEAVGVCQGIADGIAANMDLIDDSNGYYGDMFKKAIRKMVDHIKQENPRHLQKRQYVSYLHERFITNDPDYFQEFYEEALRAICTTREDLEYWRMLHEPLVPDHVPDRENFSKYYDAAVLVRMQAYILGELCDAALEDLCRKYYRTVPEICQTYIRILADYNIDKARLVAKEGKSLFPRSDMTVPGTGPGADRGTA